MQTATPAKRLILLIDDSESFCSDFRYFTRDIFDVVCSNNGDDGLTQVRMLAPDVVLLDMRFGNKAEEGLRILRQIKRVDPDLPVIIITDFPEVDHAVEAMRMGAEHYAGKTADIQTLKVLIEHQIRTMPWRRLYREEQNKKTQHLIGQSAIMDKVRQEIERCARVDIPVLITGESGTGKELVAHSIHRQSRRAGQVMMQINCSALPTPLFESEIFGHEQGAFTGAHKRKQGKLELADKGTLFLDEVAELPIESQPKLLDAIEYKRFYRLSGLQQLAADARIIAATNRDLEECIARGTFRRDLYYRINGVRLHIPPLRDHAEDIPELARHYLELACVEMRRPVPKIPSNVMRQWQSYHWPGNVRELKWKMEQVALYTDGDSVTMMMPIVAQQDSGLGLFYRQLFDLPYSEAKDALLGKFQEDYISRALVKNEYNVSKTADESGINRSTVYRVLRSMERKNNNSSDDSSDTGLVAF